MFRFLAGFLVCALFALLAPTSAQQPKDAPKALPTSPYQLIAGDTAELQTFWTAVVNANPTVQPTITCCGTSIYASVTAGGMPMLPAKVIDVRKPKTP